MNPIKNFISPLARGSMIAAIIIGFISGCVSESDLLTAIQNQDLTRVKAVLAKKPELAQQRTTSNDTPLHLAVGVGNLPIAQALIESGADINAQRPDGKTPLFVAVEGGKPELISALLERGAKPEIATGQGLTPLHFAAAKGTGAICTLLLDNKAPIDAPDEGLRTPLWIAVKAGNTDAVKLLVSRKANLDAADKNGIAVIILAAIEGRREIFDLLVNAGAKTAGPDQKPLPGLLHAVAGGGFSDLVTRLVKQGADVNLVHGGSGATPLHYAALAGKADICKILVLDYKANVNVPDKQGKTPLDLATQKNHAEVIEFLKQHGGRSSTPDQPSPPPEK